MKKLILKRRGFTLLEIVVSILVLMLGVGLIMYVFPAAFNYLSHSKDVTVATFLAQSKMEELKSYGANIPNSQFGEYAAPDNPNFMYKVEKLSLWGGYKEIKVSVSKPARTGQGQIIARVYAEMSQITGGENKQKIYKTYSNYGQGLNYRITSFNYNNYVLTQTIDCPEDGVLKISFTCAAGSYSQEHFEFAVFMDGVEIPGSESGTGNDIDWLTIKGLSLTTATKVTKGSHTVRTLGYTYFTSRAYIANPTMIIHYIPNSQVDYIQ